MVDWTNEQITSEAVRFAIEEGYPVPVKVELSERMSRSWGRAYPHSRVIKLNKRFVEINDDDVIRALIKHEVVHLKHPDHQKGFIDEMGKHGGCSHVYEDSGLRVIVERYRYECVECGREYKSAGKLTGMYKCSDCGGCVEFSGVGVMEIGELRQSYLLGF